VRSVLIVAAGAATVGGVDGPASMLDFVVRRPGELGRLSVCEDPNSASGLAGCFLRFFCCNEANPL